MARQRHLKNAPIIEALIDIQVKLSPDIGVSKIREIHEKISDQYPKEIERIKGSFTLKIKDKAPEAPLTNLSLIGYVYSSIDEKKILQARLDGFTFSKLKPYVSWEELKEEAYNLWSLYIKTVEPDVITRIAVRYINRLEIPLPFKNFKEYLTAPPTVPLELPISSFLTRVIIPFPETKTTAVINQALEPMTSERFVSIILDIDIFEEATDEKNKIKFENIWDRLEEFRSLKNKIFFESITEEAVRLWE